MFGKQGPATVLCRMREHAATALQQSLLSDLGRVGEIAPMPAMFPVKCKVLYTAKDKALKTISITLNGVCVAGTKRSNLAFDASQRMEFQEQINAVLDDVYETSKLKVKSAMKSDALNQLFTQGFQCKMDDSKMSCLLEIDGGNQEIGKVLRNQSAAAVYANAGQRQGLGLIFELTEDV